MKEQKNKKVTVKKVTKISNNQKKKFTRQMATRIWSDSSFLEKELNKYQNIKVIYD